MRHYFVTLLLPLALLFSTHSQAADSPPIDLKDLGFSQQAVQANPDESLLLQKRTHMLQLHQVMGYTTAALVLATVLAAPDGRERAGPAHIGLAIAAEASYAYTAYLSLSAPEIAGKGKAGYGTKIHKAMVWVHLPAMALLPFAGIAAQQARMRGERPTGLGGIHKTLGELAVASILVSAVSMTIEF